MNAYTIKSAAEKFLRDYYRLANIDRLKECEHDHLECSTHKHGPCFNEVLASFPELDEDNS